MNESQKARFNIYLKMFTDGNVSLDYLKNIIVRDKILKTEKGKTLDRFPSFLVFESDLIEDIFDESSYKVNTEDMRIVLASVVDYIENSIFSQDVATLNNLASKFETAITINNEANKKLSEELLKLNEIDQRLQSQLLEAKKTFTAYDVVMGSASSSPDPVTVMNEQYKTQIEAELRKQSELKLQLEQQAELKKLEEQKALILSQELEKAKLESETKVTTAIKEAEKTQESYNQEFTETVKRVEEGGVVDNVNKEVKTTSETKKTSLVPVVIGVAVLASVFMGGEE